MSGLLEERAMLVSLSIKQWSARKLDKEITAEVASTHRVTTDAGNYNKALLSKDALEEIKRVGTDARTYLYAHTAAWLDDGTRILPATLYLDFTARMRQYQDRFSRAADTFAARYPDLVNQARVRLNGMFKSDDYPPADEIRGKFKLDCATLPIPTAADFRVDIATDELDRIKSDIETRTRETINNSMSDLWDRARAACSAMIERLSEDRGDGKPKIFRDSLVGNVAQLVDLLPALNVARIPELDDAARKMKDELTKYSADELRDDAEARRETADAARKILGEMPSDPATPTPQPTPTPDADMLAGYMS